MSQLENVVIVGGGSAGWMTAAYLSEILKDNTKKPIKITLIESDNIGKIGVGEATVVSIKYFLQRLGISEREFLRETDGTFKQAIRFTNWAYDPAEKPHHYYHPFDNPILDNDLDVASYWVRQKLEGKTSLPFDAATSVQPAVCEAFLGPKRLVDKEYEGPLNYAYHFDAIKFANYLAKYGKARGVRHIIDDVIEINLDPESGYISSVTTNDNGDIKGDLFIDCTGFASHLLGKKLDIGFTDYSWSLFCDRAVTMRVPHSGPEHKIAPFTNSTAEKGGWIWEIHLRNRRGTGYVYSSNHVSDTEAQDVLRRYVGTAAKDLETRIVPMRIGHRNKLWHKNCVSIGLSGGFIEPLESTGIYLIEISIYALQDYFPTNGGFEPLSRQYNRVVTASFESIISFVKLHYSHSQREDTEFWRANRDSSTFPEKLKEFNELFEYLTPPHNNPILPNSFANASSFQYILYGLDYVPKGVSGQGSYSSYDVVNEHFKLVQIRQKQALEALPGHNELLSHLTD